MTAWQMRPHNEELWFALYLLYLYHLAYNVFVNYSRNADVIISKETSFSLSLEMFGLRRSEKQAYPEGDQIMIKADCGRQATKWS